MPTAIPTSSTIEEVVLSTGSQRPGMASSEIAEITAVPASSSGMPAAISAPNTTSSRTSETGIEVTSAFLKSWPVMLPIARSTLAPPASSTFSPGWCAWTAATAFSAGTTAVSSLPGLPATLKVTSADRAFLAGANQAGAGERGLDAGGGPGQRPQRRDDLADRLPHLRVAGVGLTGRTALDEHALAVGLLHDRAGRGPVRPCPPGQGRSCSRCWCRAGARPPPPRRPAAASRTRRSCDDGRTSRPLVPRWAPVRAASYPWP